MTRTVWNCRAESSASGYGYGGYGYAGACGIALPPPPRPHGHPAVRYHVQPPVLCHPTSYPCCSFSIQFNGIQLAVPMKVLLVRFWLFGFPPFHRDSGWNRDADAETVTPPCEPVDKKRCEPCPRSRIAARSMPCGSVLPHTKNWTWNLTLCVRNCSVCGCRQR